MVNPGQGPVPPTRKGQQTTGQSQKHKLIISDININKQKQQQQALQSATVKQNGQIQNLTNSQQCQPNAQPQQKMGPLKPATSSQHQTVKQSPSLQKLQRKLSSTEDISLNKPTEGKNSNQILQAKQILSQHVTKQISNPLANHKPLNNKIIEYQKKMNATKNQVMQNKQDKRPMFQKSKSVEVIAPQKQPTSLVASVSTVSLTNSVQTLPPVGSLKKSMNMVVNSSSAPNTFVPSVSKSIPSISENDSVILSTLVIKPSTEPCDDNTVGKSLDFMKAVSVEINCAEPAQINLSSTGLPQLETKKISEENMVMPTEDLNDLVQTDKKVSENSQLDSSTHPKVCETIEILDGPPTTIMVTPPTPAVTESAHSSSNTEANKETVSSITSVQKPDETCTSDTKSSTTTMPTQAVNQDTLVSSHKPSLSLEDAGTTPLEVTNGCAVNGGSNFLRPTSFGKEFEEIPGLLTPPPSPPTLSLLQENETQIRNAIKENSIKLDGENSTEEKNLPDCNTDSKLKVREQDGEKSIKESNNNDDNEKLSKAIEEAIDTINDSEEDKKHNSDLSGTVTTNDSDSVNKSGDDSPENSEHLNDSSEEVVLGKIILGGPVSDQTYLDNNNNDSEGFLKLYGKELSTIEAKYQDQVDKLALALADKQQELANSKQEAEKLLKQSEERRRREKQELQDKLEKEKKELDVLNKKKTENEKEKRDLEEHNKRLEEEAAKAREADKSTKKDGREGSGEDGGDKDDEESEEECNKRKMEKIQNELLLLKQQNEEFEEMVREKHRKQIELEIEIGEIKREVTDREAKVDSVKVELCYSKNETELARAKTKRLEEEITEHKERVDTLERELDTSERELKRMEILQEKLRGTEAKRNELQTQLDEIEIERDEEIKIIQDALDEAAQEREELLTTFEKEIEKLNSLNAARETQMLEDFESKLKELEKQHKQEKDKLSETSIQHRGKRQPDEEEIRQRLDKMKSELNSEWEDKLRSERSRLKGDLDNLHAEEKHLAVESIRVQKEQDLQNLKKTFDAKAEEMEKELSNLKESLAAKDGFYRKELEDMRGVADRDVWELRRKLQKLDESSYDRQQYLEDKHREDIERLREDYADKMSGMEAQLSSFDVIGLTELRATLEKRHKEQMEHLGEQHSLSMVRLRDELESEKIQAAEDARVIVSKHHEYINTSLTEQLTEAITANTQYRDEIEAIRFALSRREEVIRSLEEDIAKLRSSSKGITPLTTGLPPSSVGAVGGASPPSSPFSHEGSQGSRSSQDRLSSDGVDEDGHRSSGLLGKVFGGGWFSGTKSKDTSPGHGGSAPTGSARRGSSGLYKQAW